MSEKITRLRDHDALEHVMQTFMTEQTHIDLLNLCTTDGFNIRLINKLESGVEEDKVAAVASTFCSIGKSAAASMINQKMLVSSIETTSGHLLFARVAFLNHPCVLAVAASGQISLGEARYKTIQLARKINDMAG